MLLIGKMAIIVVRVLVYRTSLSALAEMLNVNYDIQRVPFEVRRIRCRWQDSLRMLNKFQHAEYGGYVPKSIGLTSGRNGSVLPTYDRRQAPTA